MSEALVIIDVQRGMFAFPEMQPHDGAVTVERIAGLLAQARAASTPVFFVQHEGEAGHPLEPGTEGFPFHESLTPLDSEPVTRKRHCNAFQETALESALRDAGIKRLVVTGMQSNYCVDTFVRAAFDAALPSASSRMVTQLLIRRYCQPARLLRITTTRWMVVLQHWLQQVMCVSAANLDFTSTAPAQPSRHPCPLAPSLHRRGIRLMPRRQER
jgi:hypothetical protein